MCRPARAVFGVRREILLRRVCPQKQENLERLVPEFDLQTLLAQFARMQVDFEYAKADRAAITGHI